MWLKLSGELFYFGPGGVTSVKEIDRRDKPSSYIFFTELYCGTSRIGLVCEKISEIEEQLIKKKGKKND